MTEKLKYVNESCDKVIANCGFEFMHGIKEAYRMKTARGKVVVVVDTSRNCLNDVFTLSEYSKEDLNKTIEVMCGVYGDINKISFLIQCLYRDDKIFHNYVSMLYLSRFSVESYGRGRSMLELIILDLCSRIEMAKSQLSVSVRGLTYIYTDGVEIYYSFNDSENSLVYIPNEYEYEVLTRAKAWNGSIQR